MKKAEQTKINCTVVTNFENALEEYNPTYFEVETKRLYHCTAWVYESQNYYILSSYNTIIAVLDKKQKTLYDALRYVYGYIATSAQHIAKFANKYGATKVLRYYPV